MEESGRLDAQLSDKVKLLINLSKERVAMWKTKIYRQPCDHQIQVEKYIELFEAAVNK